MGKMLATVRDTIPSNCAYMIFEELIRKEWNKNATNRRYRIHQEI